MKKLGTLLLIATFLMTGMNTIMAQVNVGSHDISLGIPEVAMLDIESTSGSNTISLGATAPSDAGDPLDFSATNSSLWINYSSIVNSTNDLTRSVSAKVSNNTVPSGMLLNLSLGDATSTNSGGTLGTTTNGSTPIALTANDQQIVSGIGSCYTGSPELNGHQLTYSIDADATNYEDLVANSVSVTIMYTLSDN